MKGGLFSETRVHILHCGRAETTLVIDCDDVTRAMGTAISKADICAPPLDTAAAAAWICEATDESLERTSEFHSWIGALAS
jgi:hypothetical protein